MRRIINSLGVVVLIALFAIVSSCSDAKQEVKQFAADFAAKVSRNQKDSLITVWPDVVKADSLALSFNPDSIAVEETETKGQFKVKLSQKADILVNKGEDGSITVSKSHGLFSYPESKISFARKTGWIEEEMSDTEIAERFQDTLFIASIGNNIIKEIEAYLIVANTQYDVMELTGLGETTWYLTIKNRSSYNISKTDYHVLGVFEKYSEFSGFKKITKKIPGIDISANSSAAILYDHTIRDESPWEAKIVLDINAEDAVFKFYIPKGDEYKNYKDKSLLSK